MEVLDCVGKGRQVLWIRGRIAERRWCGQTSGLHFDFEEVGKDRDARNGGKAKVIPRADVADIPPKVFESAVAITTSFFRDRKHGWIGLGEIGGERVDSIGIIAGPKGEFGRQPSRVWDCSSGKRERDEIIQ